MKPEEDNPGSADRSRVTAFIAGVVWTQDEGPVETEVIVRGGRIAQLGSMTEDMLGTVDDVIDLRGGTLLPAFGDGHAHPMFGGLEDQLAPVRQGSVEQIVASVASYAQAHPELPWIQGWGYDPTLVADGRFDARSLDAAVADRPVALRATDYHTVWCNTRALQLAGISTDTPEPDGGEIVRRHDGSPLGTLREWGATDLVLDLAPGQTVDEQVAALGTATDRYAGHGVGWIQDAWVEPDMVEAYLTAAERNALHCRVNLAFRADPARWREQVTSFGEQRARVTDSGYERLTAHTVKFFADGVIEAGTAALLSPYTDCPHSHGMPNWEDSELRAAVAEFDAAGFQIHIHAIGDAAIRLSLDALAAAIDVNPLWDRRPVIAHVQLVQPDDLPRFAELGVLACFQPLWAQLDPLQTKLTIPRLGRERGDLQYPIGAIQRTGARISFGSDWPVSDLNPLAGIAVGLTRHAPDQPDAWTPEQRISLTEAVSGYTSGTAYQAYRDDSGAIAVGRTADLTWLDLDLRTATAQDLRDAKILGTWLGGQATR